MTERKDNVFRIPRFIISKTGFVIAVASVDTLTEMECVLPVYVGIVTQFGTGNSRT